jgi:hypothetical protein
VVVSKVVKAAPRIVGVGVDIVLVPDLVWELLLMLLLLCLLLAEESSANKSPN